MSTLRDYHVFKDSLLLGKKFAIPNSYMIAGSMPGDYNLPSATLAVYNTTTFVFIDTFSTINTAFWDVSGLGSAVINAGRLVTEAATNTWGALFVSTAKYLGEIRENIDVSVSLEWVGRSSDLCEHYLYLRDSTGAAAYVGMNDVLSDTNSGTLRAAIGATTWSGTAYGAGASGSAMLRAEVRGHSISLYIDGSFKVSGTLPGFITGIGLTNTRYQTYNGKTAIWDNFSIVEV